MQFESPFLCVCLCCRGFLSDWSFRRVAVSISILRMCRVKLTWVEAFTTKQTSTVDGGRNMSSSHAISTSTTMWTHIENWTVFRLDLIHDVMFDVFGVFDVFDVSFSFLLSSSGQRNWTINGQSRFSGVEHYARFHKRFLHHKWHNDDPNWQQFMRNKQSTGKDKMIFTIKLVKSSFP